MASCALLFLSGWNVEVMARAQAALLALGGSSLKMVEEQEERLGLL